MKKIAILYGGLSQGDIFPKCFETHKKYLIDNNKNYEFDIFIHHWIDDGNLHKWCPHYKKLAKVNYEIDKEFIFDKIKPKKHLFEPQIDVSGKEYEKYIGEGFKTYGGLNKHPTWNNLMRSDKLNTTLNFTLISMLLSYYKCKELMVEYENEMNFKYDIIITFRPEYYLLKKINIDNFDTSLFNTFNCWWYNRIIPVNNILNEKCKYNNGKKCFRPEVILNLFNIFNRDIGLKVLNYFLSIKKYHVSNKIIQKYCTFKLDQNMTDTTFYPYAKYLLYNKIKVHQCCDNFYGATMRCKDITVCHYHIPPHLYSLYYGKKLDYKEILEIEKTETFDIKQYPNFWDYDQHDFLIPIGEPSTINGK